MVSERQIWTQKGRVSEAETGPELLKQIDIQAMLESDRVIERQLEQGRMSKRDRYRMGDTERERDERERESFRGTGKIER